MTIRKFTNHKHFSLLLIISFIVVISIWIYLPYLLNNDVFMIGDDSKMQYSHFFNLLKNMLRSSGLPFYSFELFLGGDFFSNRLFLNFDVIDYVSVFFEQNYYYLIMLQNTIRYILAGFSFYYFGRVMKFNDKSIILLSICYVFSAWSFEMTKDPFLLSFYMFLPLYFAGIERYLSYNKFGLFLIMVVYLLTDNYYFFYTLSVFTPIYFIARFYTLNKRGIVKSAAVLIKYYLIAVMISAVIVIPQALVVLQNSRIGYLSDIAAYGDIRPYLAILNGLFNYNSISANMLSEFQSVFVYSSASGLTYMSLSISSVALISILFILTLNKKTINYKINRIMLVMLIIILIIPIFNSTFQGFSEPTFRWSILIYFWMLSSIGVMINGADFKIEYSILRKIIIFVLLVNLISYLIAIISGLYFDKKQLALQLLYIAFMLASCICIYKKATKTLIIVVIIEIFSISYLSFYGNPYYRRYDWNTLNRYESILIDQNSLAKYLLELDDNNDTSFYRIFIPYNSTGWSFSHNFNLRYNYKSIMTYDSTYEQSVDPFLNLMNSRYSIPWMIDINNYDVMNFLNVKYAFVTTSEEIPFDNYKYLGEYNYLYVYENSDYMNLGSTKLYINSIDNIMYDNLKIFNDTIIINEIFDSSNYITSTIKDADYVYQSANKLEFEVVMPDKGLFVTSIPFNPGFNITSNSCEVEISNVNGGFIGIHLDEGYQYVSMNFIPQGLRLGLIISGIGIIMLFVELVINKYFSHK